MDDQTFIEYCRIGNIAEITKALSAIALFPIGEGLCAASYWGHYDIVKLLLPYCDDTLSKFKTDPTHAFMGAVQCNHFNICQLLAKDALVDASANDNWCLWWASKEGFVDIVKLLLKDEDVASHAGDQHDRALRAACQNGHLEIVNLLLACPSVNPATFDNDAIVMAASFGHVDVVDRLLTDPMGRVDPAARQNLAIVGAAGNGHYAATERLLRDPRVNPSNVWSPMHSPIEMACLKGYTAIVELLLKHPKVVPIGIYHYGLPNAAKNGHEGVVRALLKDPRFVCDRAKSIDVPIAIKNAEEEGHYNIVELLADFDETVLCAKM